MKKIITEAFIEKCLKLLAKEGESIHTVARKLKTSPSSVYRATGGKERANANSKKAVAKWVETQRVGRTKTGAKRSGSTAKAKLQKGHNKRRKSARSLAAEIRAL